MISVTSGSGGRLSGISNEVYQQDGGSDTSNVDDINSTNSESEKRQQELQDESQGVENPPSRPSDVQFGADPPSRASVSTSGTEQSARSDLEKAVPEQVSGRESTETVAGGREPAAYGAKVELAPPKSSSRAHDRRQSMSIIDTVFRRRRRQSAAPGRQDFSDSELSSTNTTNDPTSTTSSDVWRSRTCRQLDEEAATSSSTAEHDEVDRQRKLPSSSSWQQKVRSSLFSKQNYPGRLQCVFS